MSITLSVILITALAVALPASADPADFRQWATRAATEAAGAGRSTVVGSHGWLYFAPELRHLGAGPFWGGAASKVSAASKPDHADPLPAIVDFKAQLEQAGVELLLVPVPAKAAIYPEHLPGAPQVAGRIDAAHAAFYAALAGSGVKVIDLAPAFATAKGPVPLYCRTDSHWSGEGCQVAARRIAQEVKQRPWFGAIDKATFASEKKSIEITGDLARGAKNVGKETLGVRLVGTKQGDRMTPVAPARDSPILLLGDSHTLVFHAGGDLFAAGAGLPDQLALELGTAVDVLGVRGSGATPARVNLARRIRADAGYLKGKKLVIWCFAVRELTESAGWQKVPLRGAGGQ